ncbi:unnamed protein product [Pleuronectes platessa]|uniref:Transcription factor IIIA n=1 Tax=Pleuronectes platessa TaxID=8262 RepID=A0A9N7U7Q5_PLEPL|nr:unnamed protein product [Pleuronectes platessa]
MRFTFPSKLKRHEKVHRGYACEEEDCSFRAKTWTEHLKHRKEQHRPALRCEQCSKVFRDSWFLQQHQRVHSDVRLVFKCPRDGCGRSFTKIFNLQSHINSFHEELQPFACPHPGCGKTFVMKQSLQRHSVAHDPERRKLKKPRKSKPRRSLASKLSGHAEAKKLQEPESGSRGSAEKSCDPPGPVELVSLLQDASLLYSPAGVDTHGLTRALTLLYQCRLWSSQQNKMMPRSFHSCRLTSGNSRLALQALIQQDRSISAVFLPPPLLLSRRLSTSHSALSLPSLERWKECVGPFALSVQVTGKWKLSVSGV